jgi:hypothetical protein
VRVSLELILPLKNAFSKETPAKQKIIFTPLFELDMREP